MPREHVRGEAVDQRPLTDRKRETLEGQERRHRSRSRGCLCGGPHGRGKRTNSKYLYLTLAVGNPPDPVPAPSRTRRTNPARSARLKRRRTLRMQCIKMSCKTFCKGDAILAELEIAVRTMTRLGVEASRFLNLWVARELYLGRELPK